MNDRLYYDYTHHSLREKRRAARDAEDDVDREIAERAKALQLAVPPLRPKYIIRRRLKTVAPPPSPAADDRTAARCLWSPPQKAAP